MKKALLIGLSLCFLQFVSAQTVFITRNGQISFSSRSVVEKIDAINNEVSSVLNTQTGEMVFAVLLKGFHFKRALMEEHFNENYVESDKYPRSTFKGNIANPGEVNFGKDGTYKVTVTGDLTIHNTTQKVSAPGTIIVSNGKITAVSKFPVKLKDYNIKIPAIVADKISEDIDIVVDCKYDLKRG
jgi:hypothetical protein